MKKFVCLFLVIFLTLMITGCDTINDLLGNPTRGLVYTLLEDGTGYSVNKGTMNDVKKLIIAETYEDLPVKIIEDKAFIDCTSIEEVVIPNTITQIGTEAFKGCSSLIELIIPNSVKTINKSAFFGCSSLKSYSSPFVGGGISNNYIGYIFGASIPFDNGAYVPKSLENISITNNERSIDFCAFSFLPNLKTVNIIDTQRYVAPGILEGCTSIQKITLPFVIPAIAYLFNDYKKIPETLEEINFNYCDQNIISTSFFSNCKGLKKVNIPKSIQMIGAQAFFDCTNLPYIFIPKDVYGIDANAISNCPNLTIYCEVLSKPTMWNEQWNPSNRPVVWGVTEAEYNNLINQ